MSSLQSEIVLPGASGGPSIARPMSAREDDIEPQPACVNFLARDPNGGPQAYLAIVDASTGTTTLVDGFGNVQRFAGVMGDVAQREKTTLELRDAIAAKQIALAEAAPPNRAKTEFLASISHEFRTPLTSSVGFFDLPVLSSTARAVAATQADAR